MAQKKTAAQKIKRMAEISVTYKKLKKRIALTDKRRNELVRERTKLYISLSEEDKELYAEKILRSTMLE